MLKVGLIGTRGLPNVHGGFERFAELLVEDPRWQGADIEFVVYGEYNDDRYNEWTRQRNVGFTKNSRRFWFYFRSCILATRECDIVLCCSVPLSIFSYWPGLFGKPLIMNPDGCEWRRTKWSTVGRWLIAAMYVPAIAAAKKVVIDAEALRSDFKLKAKGIYIPYAAPDPTVHVLREETRVRAGVTRPYVLVVARLEPENNVALVVDAFRSLGDCGADLIVVGNATTPHYHEVLASAASDNIHFVGGIYDQKMLDELRSNCIGYFHGHSVGGTNPSLLEALAAVRGRMLCHDNKYNREVAGSEAEYFDAPAKLAGRITDVIAEAKTDPWPRQPLRDERFHPETIFQKYKALFLSLAPKKA
ncbi:MAG: glycosyltransferase [Brevundimonas sp.]|nr:MAG: glycosyltransferase [Brevundimonas sp.]